MMEINDANVVWIKPDTGVDVMVEDDNFGASVDEGLISGINPLGGVSKGVWATID